MHSENVSFIIDVTGILSEFYNSIPVIGTDCSIISGIEITILITNYLYNLEIICKRIDQDLASLPSREDAPPKNCLWINLITSTNVSCLITSRVLAFFSHIVLFIDSIAQEVLVIQLSRLSNLWIKLLTKQASFHPFAKQQDLNSLSPVNGFYIRHEKMRTCAALASRKISYCSCKLVSKLSTAFILGIAKAPVKAWVSPVKAWRIEKIILFLLFS
ncbi:19530_t:CDS:2 [Funneliformis geosporum]|nr:19530_t:CDS:2 [Funneliformis geosporum]